MDIVATQLEQLKRELEHSQRQTNLVLQIAQASVEPGDLGDLMRRALEILVRANDWVFGQLWIPDAEQEIIRCSRWYFSTGHLPEIRAASADRQMSKGVGLPGRVWATGLPTVIPDIPATVGLEFPRRQSALRSGLTSAFAFAIKNGPFITGVFEFFDAKPIKLEPSDNLFYEKLGVFLATLIAQKETEQVAREQEQVNKIVLAHAYNAFLSVNETSIITRWTERCEELFGWTAEEALGKPLTEVIIPERYRSAHMKGLFGYLHTKEGAIINKRVMAPAVHKQGHEIMVELFIFPIETGGRTQFGAFIIDRTREEASPEVRLN